MRIKVKKEGIPALFEIKKVKIRIDKDTVKMSFYFNNDDYCVANLYKRFNENDEQAKEEAYKEALAYQEELLVSGYLNLIYGEPTSVLRDDSWY